MPSYDLCPTIRISGITAQIARAVTAIAARMDGPLVLTGHSAGDIWLHGWAVPMWG